MHCPPTRSLSRVQGPSLGIQLPLARPHRHRRVCSTAVPRTWPWTARPATWRLGLRKGPSILSINLEHFAACGPEWFLSLSIKLRSGVQGGGGAGPLGEARCLVLASADDRGCAREDGARGARQGFKAWIHPAEQKTAGGALLCTNLRAHHLQASLAWGGQASLRVRAHAHSGPGKTQSPGILLPPPATAPDSCPENLHD